MNRDLLIEIGVEELPYSSMKQMLGNMKQQFSDWLKNSSIEFDSTVFKLTPRRMIFYVKNVCPVQKILPQKVKGPPVSIALKNGESTPALNGFLKKCGAESYNVETIKGQDYVVATVSPKCLSTKEVIENNFHEWIKKYPFDKNMTWNGNHFVRPVRWVCSLYGNETLNVSMFGIDSSFISRGLRGFEPIVVAEAEKYFECMENNFVITDTQERFEIISNAVRSDAPIEIIERNAFCTEYPIVCKTEFSEKLLGIPNEATQTMIEDHLICFTMKKENGELLNSFQFVMNGPRDEEKVAQGYKKVVTAKLEDSSFFFFQDRKIKMENRESMIDKMVFIRGLGTLLQKTKRLQSLSTKFVCGQPVEMLQRAAFLSKMDLPSHMVSELPELQGTMGRIYASLDGENPDVCIAIEDAYSPRRESDTIPKTGIGATLGVLDRVDTLAGALAIGTAVSGSADPLGLRRQMNGLLRILYSKGIKISLKDVFYSALELYKKENNLDFDLETTLKKAKGFYMNRLKLFLQALHRYDFVNAVLINDWGHPSELKKKIELLKENACKDEFKTLCESFTRIKNITKGKYNEQIVDESLFEQIEEKELFSQLKIVMDKINNTIDYNTQIEEMYSLNKLIENFFDNVLVNCDENLAKENRYRLISAVNLLLLKFCDFSNVVFQGGN